MKALNIDQLVTQVIHRIVILKARDTSQAIPLPDLEVIMLTEQPDGLSLAQKITAVSPVLQGSRFTAAEMGTLLHRLTKSYTNRRAVVNQLEKMPTLMVKQPVEKQAGAPLPMQHYTTSAQWND